METPSGAEFISPAHVRHVMRYVNAGKYIPPHSLILDAACGTGYGSKILAKTCNSIVIGLDASSQAIAEAEREYSNDCKFRITDLFAAKYAAVDAIVSIETIEHFSRIDGMRLVQKFHDWLSPEGILVLSTPYCSHSGPSPITKQHLWEYSLTDFEMLLNDCGFKIDGIQLDRHEGQAGRLGYCMVKAIKK